MTAEKSSSGAKPRKTKVRFQGLDAKEERPDLEVSALDTQGRTLAAVQVGKDGTFALADSVLKKAHRVRIGPKADDAAEARSASLTYRTEDFLAIREAGVLDIGKGIWEGWFFHTHCVSGRVSRCRRGPWWHTELLKAARTPLLSKSALGDATIAGLSSGSAIRKARPIPGALSTADLIAFPERCSPICIGTVEVYRRVCCCEPWVFQDPRFDGLLEELEDIIRGIPEIPEGPRPPGPDPDPIALNSPLIKEGALDERVLNAAQDLRALRALPADRVVEYINARPYLLCRRYSCGAPVKVAEGRIGPDGRFNICWSQFPISYRRGCSPKYAYIVRQRRGFFNFIIYNGLATNQWFNLNDEAHLKSYSPWAIACRDNGGPGDAFVYLDVIGATGAELLETPNADSATSVDTPVANSGLAYPTGTTAPGGVNDRNWGGQLNLSFMFSEDLRTLGAKYYRVSVTEADAAGDPVGDPEYYTKGLSWTKAVSTGGGNVDIVPVGLGPQTVATPGPADDQDNCYEIPFDGDLPTAANWEADQHHVELVTTDPSKNWSEIPMVGGQPVNDQPTKRRLVTIEIFNAAGERLRPIGTDPTGLDGPEVEAAFTFRRKFQASGSTNMVPFGALTHLFWWDNRDVVAKIEDLRMDGIQSNEECQFLAGNSASTFGIGYRAYHPWAQFQQRHVISWKRGLSGGSDVLHNASNNVGVEPGPVGASPTHTFGHMLTHGVVPPNVPPNKCAFSVFLTTYSKRTNGETFNLPHVTDSAAFALDIGPGCPPCNCEGGDEPGGGGDDN